MKKRKVPMSILLVLVFLPVFLFAQLNDTSNLTNEDKIEIILINISDIDEIEDPEPVLISEEPSEEPEAPENESVDMEPEAIAAEETEADATEDAGGQVDEETDTDELDEENAEEVEDSGEEMDESPAEPELISSPKPSIFSRVKSAGFWGIGKAMGAGRWVLTRDYVSFVKNCINAALSLKLWIKILVSLVILIILLIIWAVYFRNSRANNLRRARRLHKSGERAHSKGDMAKADECYRKAREYREKAQEQW